MENELNKKYILWQNYGVEGWSPTGFNSLKEAVEFVRYSNNFVITSGEIDYKVTE